MPAEFELNAWIRRLIVKRNYYVPEAAEKSVSSPNFKESVSNVLKKFFQHSKYLLFQEPCRVCHRFIHPEIAGMDRQSYSPHATVPWAEKQLLLDCLCRGCWLNLHHGIPSNGINRLPLSYGEIQELRITSATNFVGEIKKLIYQFKYDGDLLLARDLAIFMLPSWEIIEPSIDPESAIFVPVPLHWTRSRERGFNQAEVLSRHLSRLTQVQLSLQALSRKRKTQSQQKLGKQQRLSNVRSAFKASRKYVEGRKIILVDDVCTSGATLSECANSLYEAGADSVYAITIARVL